MPYKLTRDEHNNARLELSGVLTQADLELLLRDLTPPELIENTPPILVLVDARPLQKVELAARQGLVELSRRRTAKKIAVVGLSPYVRVLANFISKAAGKDNFRLFGSAEEATAWLNV
jgi:hypothetical protein